MSHSTYTVEAIVGLTGSGKTTFAMMKAIEHAVATGQRVYTNMGLSRDGLRHHMLRRYGGRFRGRVRLHRLFREIPDDQVQEFWKYVEPNSLIIIDEAQVYWYQGKQRTSQNPQLVEYLSQHRKLRHNFWYLTQYPTLVSHDLRKVTHKYWEVKNIRQRPLSFGFFHLRVPVDGFFYVGRYRDEEGEMIDSDTVFAGLPWNRWIWDCFNSRNLHGGLDKSLQGISERDAVSHPKHHIVAGGKPMQEYKRQSLGERFGGFIGRNKIALASLVLALIAFGKAGDVKRQSQATLSEIAQLTEQRFAADAQLSTGMADVKENKGIRVLAVGERTANIQGIGIVRKGHVFDGYEVLGIGAGKVTVRDHDGAVVQHHVGSLLTSEQETPQADATGTDRGGSVVGDAGVPTGEAGDNDSAGPELGGDA